MLKLSKKVLFIAACVFSVIVVKSAFCADVYTIDAVHSSVGFSVTHLMVTEVKGEFTDYSGTISYDPKDLSSSSAAVEIKAESINTRNDKRDAHLKGADFFDTAKFPAISFKNTKFVQQGDSVAITGDLTIKDVTKPVTVVVKISGPVISPMGGDSVIGLSGETTVNRQDFHVSWSKSMDNGGLVVADQVKIQVNLEAHKSKSP